MKVYGEWRSIYILELETRWIWVISFTPPRLYFRGKSSKYKLVEVCGIDNMKSDGITTQLHVTHDHFWASSFVSVAFHWCDWFYPASCQKPIALNATNCKIRNIIQFNSLLFMCRVNNNNNII
jgi:hypothetical protein